MGFTSLWKNRICKDVIWILIRFFLQIQTLLQTITVLDFSHRTCFSWTQSFPLTNIIKYSLYFINHSSMHARRARQSKFSTNTIHRNNRFRHLTRPHWRTSAKWQPLHFFGNRMQFLHRRWTKQRCGHVPKRTLRSRQPMQKRGWRVATRTQMPILP